MLPNKNAVVTSAKGLVQFQSENATIIPSDDEVQTTGLLSISESSVHFNMLGLYRYTTTLPPEGTIDRLMHLRLPIPSDDFSTVVGCAFKMNSPIEMRPGLFLHVVKTSPITTFGLCPLSLDIGLRRPSSWIVVVDIPCAILSADFLATFDHLVDCLRSRLHDKTTDPTVQGISPFNVSC
nr:unnamed protein product [Spirometra erinaceieuropaei]